MKKIILLIISFFLIFNTFNFFVHSEPIDISKLTIKDFVYIDGKKTASISENHYLKIGFNKTILLSKSDVFYKLVGSKSDIVNFTRCVDVKINVFIGSFEFIGTVKSWGNYNVDIQPVISNTLTLSDYVWWNSTFAYLSGSCINNPLTNSAMYLNVSYDTGGDLAMNSHCQANFSDIRFVTEDNTSELYHWIEYSSTGNYALFWVNISDEDYINCYYGNDVSLVNSTFNNPVNTFYLWENFTNISDWTNYAGGGFTCWGGKLIVTSSTSNRYMYRLVTDQSYMLKSRLTLNSSASGTYSQMYIKQTVPSTYNDLVANEYGLKMYYYTLYVQANDASGAKYATYYLAGILKTYVKAMSIYNSYQRAYRDNGYIVSTDTISGQTNTPAYLTCNIKNVNGLIMNYDWFFLNLYDSSNPPSFCSWISEISYCEYSNYVVNVSPADNSIVSGINVSYITGELVVLDGEADSINISIVADNGLFYINDTSNVFNGTYSLNVMLANFTSETTYIYYINITNEGCFVSYSYSFETVYFGGYTEFQILSYKINLVYEDMLKGSGEMDININIETSIFFMTILLILWIFFVSKYYETKRKIFAIIQFGLTFPLGIEIAIISLSFVFGYVLVIGIPIIGLYIIIEGLIYNKTKKE